MFGPSTTREWSYFILVVILLEFIFLHTVYTYGNSADITQQSPI